MPSDSADINEPDYDNTRLIHSLIEEYGQEGEYAPISNMSFNVETAMRTYRVIRLNDEQFRLLGRSGITISEDYGHLIRLSMDTHFVYSSLSKTYVALRELSGRSGRCHDPWKSSFSFPFLIHFQARKRAFSYLMNICNFKSSIEFQMAKLVRANNQRLKRNTAHAPFKEFPTEEISHFIAYFIGFLTGFFESVSNRYDREFFRTVESNFILFGYKDGRYFDDQYDDEDEFRRAIQELMTSGTPHEGQL